MKNIPAFILLFLPFAFSAAQTFSAGEISLFEAQAKKVTIIRDNWGIPHVYGKTDADAVFGLMYAQCEDDFNRVEMNYIEKLGRLSEIHGAAYLYDDLLIRLLIDSTEAIADYQKAEQWLKSLLDAHAAGINYYLSRHPELKPALISRFQPWYPLLWTDGSIGAINTADITAIDLERFYGNGETSYFPAVTKPVKEVQSGSNGFALAPSKTVSGNAILYINPHTSFYFRPEVQVVSEEGLNAYGAVTWGQFFVYQGFNQHCGWMHTSSNTDVADMYAEKIVSRDNLLYYEYEGKLKPVMIKDISISYLVNGQLKSRSFTTYATHHGPVMAKRDDKWVTLRSNNRNKASLVQSWLRTKATGFKDYRKIMDMRANASNNTVFADDKGNIAYWHGNFVPVRDKKLNWSKVIDGSISATEWKGLHPVKKLVHSYNPPNGWLQNCNSTPYTAAAENSPKRSDYRPYMAPDGENFRGINAVRVLNKKDVFSIDDVIAAGYDRYLAAFEILIPALIRVYEKDLDQQNPLYGRLREPIAILKAWDFYSVEKSIATTLAIEWAQRLDNSIQRVYIDEGQTDQIENTVRFAANATTDQVLPQLLEVLQELEAKFGTWQVSWGQLNRFQRLTGDINSKYDDQQPSWPVGNCSSVWGCLPAYKSDYPVGNKKRYGNNGNSFVCVVEFGPTIKAKSLLAGGESGDPASPHFKDQAERYSKGIFKEVLFYKEEVKKNAEREYHPGE